MEQASIRKLRDPYLGWRWVIDCSFHGVIGRWKNAARARAACDSHNKSEEHRLMHGSPTFDATNES